MPDRHRRDIPPQTGIQRCHLSGIWLETIQTTISLSMHVGRLSASAMHSGAQGIPFLASCIIWMRQVCGVLYWGLPRYELNSPSTNHRRDLFWHVLTQMMVQSWVSKLRPSNTAAGAFCFMSFICCGSSNCRMLSAACFCRHEQHVKIKTSHHFSIQSVWVVLEVTAL